MEAIVAPDAELGQDLEDDGIGWDTLLDDVELVSSGGDTLENGHHLLLDVRVGLQVDVCGVVGRVCGDRTTYEFLCCRKSVVDRNSLWNPQSQ